MIASEFGTSTALSGARLCVGAPNEMLADGTRGRAYVFELAGGLWTQTAELSAMLPGSSLNYFGSRALWNATELLIGAPEERVFPNRWGAVYSFGFFPEVGTTICGGQSGCPCGNSGTADTGCANSSGVGASLRVIGTPSLALDQLWFSAEAVPYRTCVLYSGRTMPGGAVLPRGDGLLCNRAPLRVLGRTTTNILGLASFGPGLAAAGAWQAGQTRVVQAWYRDSGGPCGTSMNSTNAIEIVFVP